MDSCLRGNDDYFEFEVVRGAHKILITPFDFHESRITTYELRVLFPEHLNKQVCELWKSSFRPSFDFKDFLLTPSLARELLHYSLLSWMRTMRLSQKIGRYRLTGRIAVGGTAEIYRAVLETMDGFAKTVAIKTLLPQWVGNGEIARLLVDEARVLCHLNHQSIVQVYELGEEHGVPFMAMEYVNGVDCAHLMSALQHRAMPLPRGLALAIVSQVLCALGFAHRCRGARGEPLGIVHRDLSPANILISRNGEVKITDFGIAKGAHRTDRTDVGQHRGTYAYMSPEQARGESLDRRSDLFSCGAVLFELLTGRKLFSGRSEMEVLRKVSDGMIDRAAMRAMPACLRVLFETALCVEKDARYQRSQEMMRDVHAVASELRCACGPGEIAAYMHAHVPDDECAGEDLGTIDAHDEHPTRIFRSASCKSERNWGLGRVGRGCRVAASLLLALALLATHPADGSIRRDAEHSSLLRETIRARNFLQAEAAAVRGIVTIDSVPSGARGTLDLEGEQFSIVTPFALHDIELEETMRGNIMLSAPGFRRHAETFVLARSSPSFVREVQLERTRPANLSVAARPWGLASIEGVVASQETPLVGVRVEPGSHLVTVVHPPSGRRIARRVEVVEGQSKRCSVDFSARALLRCR